MRGLNFIRKNRSARTDRPGEAGSGFGRAEGGPSSVMRRRFRWAWAAAAAAGVAVAFVAVQAMHERYVSAHTVSYYRVLLHGQEVGTLEKKEQLTALFEAKRREYQTQYPEETMVLQTEGFTTEAAASYKPMIDSEATLEKLDGMLKAYAVGVQLMVNGEPAGIVKDQATAQAVLEAVKQQFAGNAVTDAAAKPAAASLKKTSAGSSAAAAGSASAAGVESVSIREKVTVKPVKADPNKVLDVKEAAAVLTEGKEAPLVYTVQEGDTVSAIASRFGLTQKELYANNPDVKELTLQIGDQLRLTVPQPALTVVSVEKAAERLVTEPQVEIRTSNQLPKGKTKVVRPGQTGLKEMQYRLTKENGVVVKEEWLGQTVIRAALPEVVYKGTKVVGEGTGSFAWPVSSPSISSSFGERWGRAHKGLDMVSGNRTIMAADAGVVSFAGVQNGYGNVVIVNHRNGYVTYYGHLSRISVSVGQKLEKGSQIGIMGSTGRSTGTHLHFEIRKNGTALNPLKFLG
ncbi:M23 family metallopeptidase [Paenibacillus glufosinatiresistens]|uniref:M23 family metallopeptidase n=1 Tax=Paenibacillus glufosinatiresistens TaxID=3070657 RepID=UPI00286E4EE6|nr:M23 family metallopeptidase [Paenibacillus sp. YX.27]